MSWPVETIVGYAGGAQSVSACVADLEAWLQQAMPDVPGRWLAVNPHFQAMALNDLRFAKALNTANWFIPMGWALSWLPICSAASRTLRKALITGLVDPRERNGQFFYIKALRRLARWRGIPVRCVATKKKGRELQFMYRDVAMVVGARNRSPDGTDIIVH